jgi:hypothetical protein
VGKVHNFFRRSNMAPFAQPKVDTALRGAITGDGAFSPPVFMCPMRTYGQGEGNHHRGYIWGMSLSPDPPPAKPKLSHDERRARQSDRLTTIRLQMLICRTLDERGIITPGAIGAALGMPAAEAAALLSRKQWREGDVALLEAAAARLALPKP